MASGYVSPGVFTSEADLSYLPQGVAQIGAAFVGPFDRGPAFRPTTVRSQNDFTNMFGGMDTNFYTPYAVRNYLKNASQATIVRVLGLYGYNTNNTKPLFLYLTASGSGSWLVGVIHPTQTGVTLPTGSIVGSVPTNFSIVISGSSGGTTITSMSINPAASNYFASVLGTSPAGKYDGYVYAQFPDAAAFISGALQGSGSITLASSAGTELMLSGSVYGTYREAVTPFVRSQLIGGNRYDLFRFHTLGDGNSANTSLKISVANLNPDPNGGYGTFSILVRDFNDTDSKLNIFEQFDNLTLDTTSENYISRRIGDSRPVIDTNGDVYMEGEWPNISNYIYIEESTTLQSVPETALPYGFEPLAAPVNLASVPAPDYVTTRYAIPVGGSTPVANNNLFYGFDFTQDTSLSYCNPSPSGSIDSALGVHVVGFYATGSNEQPLGGADAGFDLSASLSSSDQSDIGISSNIAIRKFSVPFYGGFDGQNPAQIRYTGAAILPTNTMGFDLSDSSKDGAQAYNQAIRSISNPDSHDLNLLIMPGVIYSQHPYVAQLGMNLCSSRLDCFYVIDNDILGGTVSSAVNSVSALDTNYSGTYYPWLKIFDADSNKNIWVPPSVLMAGIYAFSDRVSAEWYAPAGLTRGGITDALQVRTRLSQADRDTLYQGRVNPIAIFAGTGIAVWGQKTLQFKASALDRINVRRMMIAVEKFIASATKYLVFEQNVDATRQRFLSIVNPYLSSVQERAGLYAFKVVMDSTNNTPDIIDRNLLVGDLWLQPTKAAEKIILRFNITPTGATFSS